MESQGRQAGGGGGTEATGEGEDEESSSSSNIDRGADVQLRPLLDDENQAPFPDEEDNDAKRSQVPEDGHGTSTMKDGKETESALEQFRKQWRSELQKASSKTNSRDASPAVAISGRSSKESTPSMVEDRSEKKHGDESSLANVDVVERARRLFQTGIDLERQGKMYEAIRFYRQALQLVPDIEKRLLVVSSGGSTNASGRTYAMVASEAAKEKQHGYDMVELPPSTPEELIEIFRHRLFVSTGGTSLCLPADKEEEEEGEDKGEGEGKEARGQPSEQTVNGIHISQLPSEVLLQIFKWVISSELDLRQLEQLSMVCCGFYIVARDPELWRLACLKIWGVRLGMLDTMYPSWRQMFVERPHLWYNGVYISKITYVRHGETAYQDQFYRPWHLVIYYRYLKFFADGTMFMLTTSDEPSVVIPGLKWKQPRFQGIVKGTYRLVGHNCIAGVLTRKASTDTNSSPFIRSRIVKQPNDLMEHVFSLVLEINSAKRRRHVQLSWSNYEVTARYRNGQTSSSKFDLCDQNFPPMYFSRVKSFAASSEAPLE